MKSLRLSLIAAGLVATLPAVGHLAAGAARAGSGACTSDMTDGGSWPTYGEDLYGTQHQTAEKTIGTANVSTLHLGWSTPSTNYEAVPIVADGCVFVVDATNGLEALSLQTGQVLWTASGGVSTAGSFAPAVLGDRIYVGAYNNGFPVAEAFDVHTGANIWASDPKATNFGGDPANQNSSAVVYTPGDFPDGVDILTTTGPDFDPKAHPGYALIDATTGATLTSHPFIPESAFTQGYAGGGVWGTPSVDPATGYAFMGTANPDSQSKEDDRTNAILKIDVDPGRSTFGQIVSFFKGNADALVPQAYSTPVCQATAGQFPVVGPYGGSPACTQTDVDFGNGPTLWHAPDGTLMLAELQKSGVLWVLDATTMTLDYSETIGVDSGPESTDIGRIATDGKTLYVDTNANLLWAIDAATGNVDWRTPTPEQVSGGNVALANGVVYYVSFNGPMAYDASTGTPLWVSAVQGNGSPNSDIGGNNPGDGTAIAGHQVVTTSTLGVITDWHL